MANIQEKLMPIKMANKQDEIANECWKNGQ